MIAVKNSLVDLIKQKKESMNSKMENVNYTVRMGSVCIPVADSF